MWLKSDEAQGFNHLALLAGDRGFEPRHTDPESAVLPLDESPTCPAFYHE
jgi:hypothetical protein